MAEMTPQTTPCTLVQAFTEFALLPDLMGRTTAPGMLPGLGPTIVGDTATLTGRWSRFLSGTGANKDHVEPGDLPRDVPWAQLLADDALVLTRRLGWVTVDDVSHAGLAVLNLGKRIPADRDQEDDEYLQGLIANAVTERYVGGDGLAVVPLLQAAAISLAEADNAWVEFVPGLLLVEFEALIHWAFAEPSRAENLRETIVEHRDEAMLGQGPPPRGADPDEAMLTHADATARYYLETDGLAKDTGLTVTALRSTAMLLSFAGLLREIPLSPVNYLMAPLWSSDHA